MYIHVYVYVEFMVTSNRLLKNGYLGSRSRRIRVFRDTYLSVFLIFPSRSHLQIMAALFIAAIGICIFFFVPTLIVRLQINWVFAACRYVAQVYHRLMCDGYGPDHVGTYTYNSHVEHGNLQHVCGSYR